MSIYDPLGVDDTVAPSVPDDGAVSSPDQSDIVVQGTEDTDTGCPPDCGDAPVDDGLLPGAETPPGTTTPLGFDDLDPAAVEFDPVDPAAVTIDPTAVVGDPAGDAAFWLYQGEGVGTCAPTSIAMVLADVLDSPMVTNEVVLQRALELGLIEYDPAGDGDVATDSVGDWSGMDTAGMMQLCESFGLDVSASYGDIGHLVESLESGRAVMVGLDAHEIWTGEDDDAGDQGYDDNHAVVVSGIDVANGLVYLNDPGTPDGQGSVVPLEQFQDAWADSGNDMIVTDFAEDQAAATVDLGTVPAETSPEILPEAAAADVTSGLGAGIGAELRPSMLPDGATGLLLLPFTFVVRIADLITAGD